MRKLTLLTGVINLGVLLGLTACTESAPPGPRPSFEANRADTLYFSSRGAEAVKRADDEGLITGPARNVILFVGDGMGISTITAARIHAGQKTGQADENGLNPAGESHLLHMDRLPYSALSKTYSVNQQTSDSAPTMTAMVTGSKTKEGFLSISGSIAKNDPNACDGSHNLATILEVAESLGLSTGVVSTARITHATPAALYAHTPHRDLEGDSSRPRLDIDPKCKDIATQLIEFPFGNGLEVALGGGRGFFFPSGAPQIEGASGRRADGRDLREEWKTRFGARAAVVQTQAEFDAVKPANVDHLLGLFEDSHMRFEADRARDIGGEPSLAEMTRKAIGMLDRNRKGYFLMVEGGRIDHGHHAGNAARALEDTLAFDEAIGLADELTRDQDTLIVVTADHSHTLTIAGYPFRGNPILGIAREANEETGDFDPRPSTDLDGKPYTTLGYANGRGFAADLAEEVPLDRVQRGRTGAVLSNEITTGLNYHQEALVPMRNETHAGEDVAILAKGPGAHLFRGIVEQSYLFHAIDRAARLRERAGL
ncbi:MAG: alkaline phosphatase [Panacagrimonas sp.]